MSAPIGLPVAISDAPGEPGRISRGRGLSAIRLVLGVHQRRVGPDVGSLLLAAIGPQLGLVGEILPRVRLRLPIVSDELPSFRYPVAVAGRASRSRVSRPFCALSRGGDVRYRRFGRWRADDGTRRSTRRTSGRPPPVRPVRGRRRCGSRSSAMRSRKSAALSRSSARCSRSSFMALSRLSATGPTREVRCPNRGASSSAGSPRRCQIVRQYATDLDSAGFRAVRRTRPSGGVAPYDSRR